MNLSDIGHCIDQGHPKNFVTMYLTCLAQGFLLPCPYDVHFDALVDKWAKVLAKYREEFTDEFCYGVAQIWMELLTRCDLNGEHFELQLIKAAGISMDDGAKTNKKAKPQKTTPLDIPAPTQSSMDDHTTPEISPTYREHQLAQSVRLPEVSRLNETYAKAFKSKNAQTFLVIHLTYAKHGQPKKVPKSTVPQHIREAWESIIGESFQTIANDEFLEALTNEWFYLVNQKGIPLTTKDQEDLLMVFLAKTKRMSPNPKGDSPYSLFKKLFG